MLTIVNNLEKEMLLIVNKVSIQHLDQITNSSLNELSTLLKGEKESIFRSRNLSHIFEKLNKTRKIQNKKLAHIALEHVKFYLGKVFYHSNKKIKNLATLKVLKRNLASIEDTQLMQIDQNCESLKKILKLSAFYDFQNNEEIRKGLAQAWGLQFKVYLGKCSLRFTGIPHDILILKGMNHSMIVTEIDYQIQNIKKHWIIIKQALSALEKSLYQHSFTNEMMRDFLDLKKSSELNKNFKQKIERLLSMMRNQHISSDTTLSSISISVSINFIPIFVYYINNLLLNLNKFINSQPRKKKSKERKESYGFDISYETDRRLRNYMEEFHQKFTTNIGFRANNFELNILTSPQEDSNDSLSVIIDEVQLKVNKKIELNIIFFRLEKTIEFNKETQKFLKKFNQNVIESFTKKKQGTDLFKSELLKIPKILIETHLDWDENFSNYTISQILPFLQKDISAHINLLSVISPPKLSLFNQSTIKNKNSNDIVTFRSKNLNTVNKFVFESDANLDELKKDEKIIPELKKNNFFDMFSKQLKVLHNQVDIFKGKMNRLNQIVGFKNKKFKLRIGIKIKGNKELQKNPILIIKVDIFNYLLKFNYPKVEFLVKNKICVLNLKKVNS
jgi:hypothetical protein